MVIQLLLAYKAIRVPASINTEKQGKLVGGLKMRLVGSSNTVYPTKSCYYSSSTHDGSFM